MGFYRAVRGFYRAVRGFYRAVRGFYFEVSGFYRQKVKKNYISKNHNLLSTNTLR
jgi:hypothetical protein